MRANMKPIKILCIPIMLLLFSCTSVEKVNLPKRGDISFLSESDGTTSIKCVASAFTFEDAVKEAEIYAIEQLFFRGLSNSQQRMPMISTSESIEKSKHKIFFDDLFGNNRYKTFVTESKTLSSVKYGSGIQVELSVTVDHRSLRRDLETNGVIRKLGY